MIKYNVDFEFTQEFINAMKNWPKPKKYMVGNDTERDKAEKKLKRLMANYKNVLALEICSTFNQYQLHCIVGGGDPSNGMLQINETTRDGGDETGITWIDPDDPSIKDLIELRETEGRPFKLKELFKKHEKKGNSLW